VVENPALISEYALIELAAIIDHGVYQWVIKQCQRLLDNKESDDGRLLLTESVQLIKSTRTKYEVSVESFPGQQESDQLPATYATMQPEKQSGDKQAARRSLPSARIEPSPPASGRIEDVPRTPRGLMIARPPARPSPLKENRTNDRAKGFISGPPVPASQKKRRPAWADGLTSSAAH
jgi:hypothetical protein